MKFILTTDSCCDESKTVLKKLGVYYAPFKYIINGESNEDDFSTDEEFGAFFDKMKAGALPTTSQAIPEDYKKIWEQAIKDTKLNNIINLSISSAISGTYASAKSAAEEFMKEHPSVKIYCVDSLTASQPFNSFLYKAIELRNVDMDAAKAFEELEKTKMFANTLFMVNDLFHLKRLGRLSGVKAVVGSILGIKPVLTFDPQGNLKVINGKLRGLKNIIPYFLDYLEKQISEETREVFFVHAGALKNVKILESKVKEKFPNLKTRIGWVGAGIGPHVGVGLMGFGFIGKKREEVK